MRSSFVLWEDHCGPEKESSGRAGLEAERPEGSGEAAAVVWQRDHGEGCVHSRDQLYRAKEAAGPRWVTG